MYLRVLFIHRVKWCGVGKVWGSASVFQMKSRMWTEPVHKFFVSSGCWGGGVDSAGLGGVVGTAVEGVDISGV